MDSMGRGLPSLAEPLLSKALSRDNGKDEVQGSRQNSESNEVTVKLSSHTEEWKSRMRASTPMTEMLRPLKLVNSNSGAMESYMKVEGTTSHHPGQADEEKNGILGVFVVSFDNHVGNTVDWCQTVWDFAQTPSSKGGPFMSTEVFSLHGLEFRALPAGIHNMEEDCLYFRHGSLFGIAAFHRLMLPDSEMAKKERHARMRSVGALAYSIIPLARCLPQLLSEACRHSSPNDYPSTNVLSHLLDFNSQPPPFLPGPPSPSLPATLPTPPPDVFGEFMNEFGVFVVTLWKALLLRRRLLFL